MDGRTQAEFGVMAIFGKRTAKHGRENGARHEITGSRQGPGPDISWSFSEGTGSTVKDGSRGGNNGTLSGSPVRTSGQLGGALSFDGVNDHVNVQDSSALELSDIIITCGSTPAGFLRALPRRWWPSARPHPPAASCFIATRQLRYVSTGKAAVEPTGGITVTHRL